MTIIFAGFKTTSRDKTTASAFGHALSLPSGATYSSFLSLYIDKLSPELSSMSTCLLSDCLHLRFTPVRLAKSSRGLKSVSIHPLHLQNDIQAPGKYFDSLHSGWCGRCKRQQRSRECGRPLLLLRRLQGGSSWTSSSCLSSNCPGREAGRGELASKEPVEQLSPSFCSTSSCSPAPAL